MLLHNTKKEKKRIANHRVLLYNTKNHFKKHDMRKKGAMNKTDVTLNSDDELTLSNENRAIFSGSCPFK